MGNRNKNGSINIDMELGVDINNLIYMYEEFMPNTKFEKKVKMVEWKKMKKTN